MSSLIGATSDRSVSLELQRLCRTAMTAIPWSPIVPVTIDAVAGAQARVAHDSVRDRDAGGVDDDAVDLAAAHHLRRP